MRYIPIVLFSVFALYVVGRMLIDYHHKQKAKRSRQALNELANGERHD